MLSYLGFSFRDSSQDFKTGLLERGFHTLIKGVSSFSLTDVESHNPPPFRVQCSAESRSFLQSTWDLHQIHSLRGLESLLAHRLMSTPFEAQPHRWHIVRCLALKPFVNSSSPSLADIVLLRLSLLGFPSMFLKRVVESKTKINLNHVRYQSRERSFLFATQPNHHIKGNYWGRNLISVT